MEKIGAGDGTDTYAEIIASHVEAVMNFGPEDILAPEKREQIVEAVTNGLDLIASTIKEEAGKRGVDMDVITPIMNWKIEDFARTALTTPPLPPQEFEESSFSGEIADAQNWWDILSADKKEAFWKILEEDFGLIRDLPRETLPSLPHWGEGFSIARSEKIITVPAAEDFTENQYQAAMVFNPSGEPAFLTCFVVK